LIVVAMVRHAEQSPSPLAEQMDRFREREASRSA
jgi:hypothetical protein